MEVAADTPVFIDETEDALGSVQKSPIEGIKSGSRIHVTHCKRIKVILKEHRFGPWTVCSPHDPRVALCGVDNAAARADLDKPGFGLVVEAGLGAGPDGFRNFSLHTFPAARRPDEIWPRNAANIKPDVSNRPAYAALQQAGLDTCGATRVASRLAALKPDAKPCSYQA